MACGGSIGRAFRRLETGDRSPAGRDKQTAGRNGEAPGLAVHGAAPELRSVREAQRGDRIGAADQQSVTRSNERKDTWVAGPPPRRSGLASLDRAVACGVDQLPGIHDEMAFGQRFRFFSGREVVSLQAIAGSRPELLLADRHLPLPTVRAVVERSA